MEKNRLVYRASRGQDGKYEHCYLEIKSLDENGYDSDVCQFSWQTDNEKGHWVPWYGCSVEVKAQSGSEFAFRVKQVNRIVKNGFAFGTLPSTILDYLDRVKAVQVIYDSRVYPHWVEIDKIMGEDIHQWGEDYRILGHRNLLADCLAKTQEEAQGLILAKLAADYPDKVEAFKRAGMPVFILNEGHKNKKPLPAREMFVQELPEEAAA